MLKNISKALLLITFSMCASMNLFAQTPVAQHGHLSVSGNRMYDENNDVYQLRGMSLFWSNWMGKYWTYETVKWLRDDWHCNVIRAAMGVSTDDNSGYLGKEDIEMHKMRTVIDAAIDLGIYVIVDWHSHHAENETEASKAFFKIIAEEYGHLPNIIYETYNEPATGSWDVIKPYHEAVVAEIRTVDPDNVIIIGTPTYSQVVSVATSSPVTGTNLCYALHYYAASHDFMGDAKAVHDNAQNPQYIFVSEFGTCEYTGDGYVDHAKSIQWWDFLDGQGMGWCNWAVSDADESAAIVQAGASIYGGWAESELTESGKLVRERLRSYPVDPLPANIAPYITSSPQSASVPFESETVLSVEVAGENLSYQWYYEGSSLSGATAPTYTIPSVSASNTGAYYVEIKNSNGTTQSNPITVETRERTVFYADTLTLPGIVQMEDYDRGGQNIGYLDTGYGNSGSGYRADDVDIELIKGTADEYAIGYTDNGEWLAYTVNVAWSADYELDVFYASEPGGGSYSVEVDGVEVVSETQIGQSGGWFDYARITKQISLTAGTHLVKFNILTGGYNIDFMEFRSLTSPEIAPVFTTQPKNINTRLGKPAFIYATTSGATPMTYQWYHDGEAVQGATESSLSIATVTEADAGEYYVIATNYLGSAQSMAGELTVLSSNAYGGYPVELPGRVFCKNFDEGGNGEGYFDDTPGSAADNFRDEDVDTEICSDGGSGYSVGYITANEWLKYSVVAKYSGTYTVGFRVASGASAGVPALSIAVDGVTKISSIAVENTGGWAVWETIEESIDLTAGGHVITIKANQGDFNINYLDFSIETTDQVISLDAGWNLVSLSVTPISSKMSTLFSGVEGAVVKNAEGSYHASYPVHLNALQEIVPGKGYLVYTSGTGQFMTVTGVGLAQAPIDAASLSLGWNLVGTGATETAVSNLPAEASSVKDFDSYYISNTGSSNLSTLEKGKAYFILKD